MSVSTRGLIMLADALRRRRTELRSRWRRLDPGKQALLVLAHLRKGDTYAELACGFGIGTSTAYRYLWEALDLLAAMAPTLAEAIEVARRKAYVVLDGTLLRIDRVGMTGGRDRPFYSGKHTAPRRRPVVYPTQSGGIGGIFLGLMPNLAPKGQGDNSMAGNRRSCPGVWNEASGDPRDMVNG